MYDRSVRHYDAVSSRGACQRGNGARKDCRHKGYAAEAASACREYAFNVPGFNEIYSIIRDNNIPSQNVAKRNGMTPAGTFVKHYYGMDMPHILYKAERK